MAASRLRGATRARRWARPASSDAGPMYLCARNVRLVVQLPEPDLNHERPVGNRPAQDGRQVRRADRRGGGRLRNGRGQPYQHDAECRQRSSRVDSHGYTSSRTIVVIRPRRDRRPSSGTIVCRASRAVAGVLGKGGQWPPGPRLRRISTRCPAPSTRNSRSATPDARACLPNSAIIWRARRRPCAGRAVRGRIYIGTLCIAPARARAVAGSVETGLQSRLVIAAYSDLCRSTAPQSQTRSQGRSGSLGQTSLLSL